MSELIGSFVFLIAEIGCASEPLRSRVNPAGRGSGGALAKTPDGLTAGATLPNGDRDCQRYFAESQLQFHARLGGPPA